MLPDKDLEMTDATRGSRATVRDGARNRSLPPISRRPSSPSLHSSESRGGSEASFAVFSEDGEGRKRTRRDTVSRVQWTHVVGIGTIHPDGCKPCDEYVDHRARHAKNPQLQEALREQAADSAAAIARGVRDALRDTERDRERMRDRESARREQDAKSIAKLKLEVERCIERIEAKNRALRTAIADRDAAHREVRRLRDELKRVITARPVATPATPQASAFAGGGGLAQNITAPVVSQTQAAQNGENQDDNSLLALAPLRTAEGTIRCPTTMEEAQLLYGAARTARNDTAYNIWGNFLQMCQRAQMRTAVQEWATKQLNSKPSWARSGKNGRRVLHLLDRASWDAASSPLGAIGGSTVGHAITQDSTAVAPPAVIVANDDVDMSPTDSPALATTPNPDVAMNDAAVNNGTPASFPAASNDATPEDVPAPSTNTLAAAAETRIREVDQVTPEPTAPVVNASGGLPPIDPGNVEAWQSMLAADPSRCIPGIVRAADGRASEEAALRGLLRVARAGPRGDGEAFLRFITVVASAIESDTDIGLPRDHPNVTPYTGTLDAASIRVHLAEYEGGPSSSTEAAADVEAWVSAIKVAATARRVQDRLSL